MNGAGERVTTASTFTQDTTLYAHWTFNANEEAAKVNEALSRLETLRNGLGSASEEAYQNGVASITSATSLAAVEQAYQAAVVAMRKAASDYGKVQVIVANNTFAKGNGAAWDGELVNTEISLTADSTAFSCVEEALTGKDLKNSKDIKSIKGSAGGSTYFVGLAGTDVMNWRWVASADNAAFSKFSTTTNLLGWVVVAASAVVFSIASLLVIGRFLGNMNGMLKTMTEISEAEGSTDIRFKVTNRRSELGEIQTSFNELLDEVFLSEERHRTIAELSDNMLFEWDFHKERMYASKNMLAKFDIDTDSATLSNGKFIDSLMSQDDSEKYKRDMNGLLKNKSGYSAEYQLKTKSGAVIWVSLRAVCITDRLGEPLRVIGVMTDIDNEKKLELQLSERASYDFLSQLYNRNTFIRNLTSEIERRGTKRVAVSFIDVDDFKFINDRYGHTIGDEVIRFVADTIRTKVDDRGGFAGRFGGDEFVLCFTNQDDIANIENISMDIINELYEGYTTADGAMHIDVKASIGVAFCPEHTEDVNELLSFADTAMYFVKKNGKTNYHIYIPEDSATDEYIDPEGF